MTFLKYLKDRSAQLITSIIIFAIIIWLLILFKLNVVAVTLVAGLLILYELICLIMDYSRKRDFYNGLIKNSELLDKAYLVLETLEKPGFLEGDLVCEALYEINKSMAENVAFFEKQGSDFAEYIEMWIHEVKLPLSAISLKLHNLVNAETVEESIPETRIDEYKKLLAETRRVEGFINQVLYYVRSGTAERDYHISKVSLGQIIHETAMTYRENLQDNNMNFMIETGDVDIGSTEVNTDQKWMVFIMGQLIANSIKYKRDNTEPYVKIITDKKKVGSEDMIYLSVEDNGIGIPAEDLKRVFEKSFTGYNGQTRTRSTGMGLYIVKELCGKLGHDVKIESEQGSWTRVTIMMKNNDYYGVV